MSWVRISIGPTHFLRWIVYYCVCIQHDIDKSQISFDELCKTLRMNSDLRAIIADCGVWTHPHFYTDLHPWFWAPQLACTLEPWPPLFDMCILWKWGLWPLTWPVLWSSGTSWPPFLMPLLLLLWLMFLYRVAQKSWHDILWKWGLWPLTWPVLWSSGTSWPPFLMPLLLLLWLMFLYRVAQKRWHDTKWHRRRWTELIYLLVIWR